MPNVFDRLSSAWEAFKSLPQSKPKSVELPARGGRSSKPDFGNPYDYSALTANLRLIQPSYILELIPIIRKLAISNPDVSQALHNITTLANTGHTITFDQLAPPEEAEKMRIHLAESSKSLLVGTPGIDGIVNKWISQLIVGGAVSTEFIPKMDLSGMDSIAFINPEHIRFLYNTYTNRYEPYQVVPLSFDSSQYEGLVNGNLLKLNPQTFKYYGLGGDTDSPYGIPRFLSALDSVDTQLMMTQNIKYIISQMGLLGFLTMMLDKPDKLDNESEVEYVARLDKLLTEAKSRTNTSFRDGVIVGFKDDTEFELHPATGRDTQGADALYQQNEQQIASGLKQDTSMWGRSYGTTESQITVVFTKMLSEFKNIHNVVKAVLEYYYKLELTMAGFKWANSVQAHFNRSTLADDLKFEQATEIKIRNLNQLYWDGIIDLDTYAYEMGRIKANKKEPRLVPNTGMTPAQIEQDRVAKEKGKNVSDKKVRDKNKVGQKKLEDSDTEAE